MNKIILFLFLLLMVFCSVGAVLMDPSVDYIAGSFTLNSRSVIDVDYINISNDPPWINLGGYGNITFMYNLSSSRSLVEVGKGYLTGGAYYTSNISVDVYAPADWTVFLTYDFNHLYVYNLSSGVWTNQTFPKYIWDSDSTISDSSGYIPVFLFHGGVWGNVDFIFRDGGPGGLISWWIDDVTNELEYIDNDIEHPEYDYFLHPTADDTLLFVKPLTDANVSHSSYYTQINTTHRQYIYPFNPLNTLDIDTVNSTNMTVTATILAYNDTLRYNGSIITYNITSIHEVGAPYGSDIIYADFNATLNSINATWNPGNNSDTTVVVRNNASWPTTPVDGYEVQNTTAVWYNESGVNSTRYYSLFGYNATTNSYSEETLIYWGALVLWNCYNESNATQAINYNIEITDANATNTYTATDIGNNHVVDLLDIPYGDDTVFTVTNSSYKLRVYYYDLAVCNFYNYSFYLAPLETTGGGGGGGENVTRQYRVHVVDDYQYPVEGAKVTIRRYLNNTVGDEYQTVAIIITDGYGDADVWLRPEQHYKVWIAKDGYLQQSPVPDWFPDATFYGANYPKTFQIYINLSEPEEYTFWGNIVFNATLYTNGTMRISYIDSLTNTTNAQFYTYEIYNFTEILNSTNTTLADSATFWLMGLNNSRAHRVILHLNHTNLGYVIETILVNPARPLENRTQVTSIITNIIGEFELPYIELLFVFIPAFGILILLSKKKVPEAGIIIAGLWIGFVSMFFALHETLVGSGVFLIFFGGLYAFVKGGKHRL